MEIERTKAEILEATQELFSRQGYHATTMKDIVEVSNTSKGTLYHYFENKLELFETMLNKVVGELYDKITGISSLEIEFEEKLERLVKALVIFYKENGDLAFTFLVSSGTDLKKKAMEWHTNFNDAIKKIISEGVEAGFLKNKNIEMLSHSLLGLTRSLTPPMVKRDFVESDQMVNFILELYLEGVKIEDVSGVR
ncbi:TetR/AcrR family transcriptional regulator [Halarsenatibacter silvermanii]|uniref:DNA-binding transcriptional regulator, AcrR family n=1 Tax=Halarsenatibacter silvermanii TaxID=321763 RepID=A0A1G9SJV9_9FIRM|nr:TetR/AcrR family transcriptional regulator [Halarsenatibacter silvermanii]SDM35590.1 DNA-binding transcriptional regulator, AcrR family [Halarsenatibacter silvermanii]